VRVHLNMDDTFLFFNKIMQEQNVFMIMICTNSHKHKLITISSYWITTFKNTWSSTQRGIIDIKCSEQACLLLRFPDSQILSISGLHKLIHLIPTQKHIRNHDAISWSMSVLTQLKVKRRNETWIGYFWERMTSYF